MLHEKITVVQQKVTQHCKSTCFKLKKSLCHLHIQLRGNFHVLLHLQKPPPPAFSKTHGKNLSKPMKQNTH